MWKIDGSSKTGTTAAAYGDALDWPVAELGQKTILLKNTGGTYSLKYRLLGYVAEGGAAGEVVAEETLLPGDTAEFHYAAQWQRLVLQVADGTGHAAYRVDYQGQGA